MESVELQKYLPISIFEFSLLKTKYVDFKNTVIDKDMIDEDGIILLPLRTYWLPKAKCEIMEEDYFYENTRNWSECYVVFNLYDRKATGLRIVNNGILHDRALCYMATIPYLRKLKRPETDKCQNLYDTFNKEVIEWVKSLIREVIINPKGEFKKDFIQNDTYFQTRESERDVYYIIYKWWRTLYNKDINFVDFCDRDVYIAER